jgi:hypothetical protein
MIKHRKKNLVISSVGDKSLHKHWIKGKPNFDLCLTYYGDKEDYSADAHYYRQAKGYKYHLIQDWLKDKPHLFDYEYIWLPDDDIYIVTDDINRLFRLMKQYRLELAQPSIMGYYGVDITLHQKGSVLRYTNWVEIMCPCFSSDALRKCYESFRENNTGWAIEMIWNKLLGHPRNKIAIIDDIVAVHTRPVLTGDTYQGKDDPLNFAMAEAKDVVKRHCLVWEMEKDLKHGTAVNGEVYGGVIYSRINKPMEAGIPKPQRVWPDVEFIKNLCEQVTSSRKQPS